MKDEKKYWEELIAWIALIFAIYPFLKDYLTETQDLSFFGNDSIAAILFAIIFGRLLFEFAKIQLSYLKKKEMDNMFNEDFD